MKEIDRIRESYRKKIQSHEYKYCHYKRFDYNILKYIMYKKKGGSGDHTSFNDVIIMADTETSKKSRMKCISKKVVQSGSPEKTILYHGRYHSGHLIRIYAHCTAGNRQA